MGGPNPQTRKLVLAPLAAGSVLLVIGGLGLLVGQPWLLPSLGPTVFLQTEQPQGESSQAYNVVVGHLTGLAVGLLAVWVFGAANAPSVLSSNGLSPDRVWASALAITLTLLGTGLLHASHPPAAATTLLVTLGGVRPTWSEIQSVLVAVLLVAVLGELARRALGRSSTAGSGPQTS